VYDAVQGSMLQCAAASTLGLALLLLLQLRYYSTTVDATTAMVALCCDALSALFESGSACTALQPLTLASLLSAHYRLCYLLVCSFKLPGVAQ
jgi:hypothetical protein